MDLARSTGRFAGALTEDVQYLALPGLARRPARQWSASIDQLTLFTLLDQLRYGAHTSETDRDEAFTRLRSIVTELLGDAITEAPTEMTQFDLVLRAAELGALPFEAAVAGDGEPLFVRTEPRAIITRRVRKEGFRETAPSWPTVPHVLYAWAAPDEEVPHEEHARVLRSALGPWIEPLDIAGFNEVVPNPDPAGILTVLPEASLSRINEICEQAARERPFSHVHVLAHGCRIGRGATSEFGIALHDPNGPTRLQAVSKEEITDALCNEGTEPSVVTFAVCDSANIANPIVGSNVAQELHTAGVPVVVASQLPLTVEGSNIFVERFYRSLFRGEDVRCALHDARVSLWEQRETGSLDWMSVVGYVELPEGYTDMLAELRLEAELASLKTARRWYDFIIERKIRDPRAFGAVAHQLEDRIRNLTDFLESGETTASVETVAENRGLLGSAEKRRAELLWLRSEHDDALNWRRDARCALERARDWYRQAFHGHLAAHWSGVQYLSLRAVLEGEITAAEWHTAIYVTELDAYEPEPYWKHGSLAELYLLASKAGFDSKLDEAKVELRELRRLSYARDTEFPLESTRLQLQRYVMWWTSENGFFGQSSDLAEDARELLQGLQ
jgi:hypothetical protein